MVDYRRNRIKGGSYFFTVNLSNRNSGLLVEHIDFLHSAFRQTKDKYPFQIDAIVVLPEHLHTLWTLPEDDDNYPLRWRSIKSLFTQGLKNCGYPIQQNSRGEHAVWQRRYWEHTIRDGNDLQGHMDYIHYNPVKHGHVKNVSDWPYSSFHQFVDKGILPRTWGSKCEETQGSYGE